MTRAEREAQAIERKNTKIRANISYYLADKGYKKQDLADLMGMSVATLYNKIKDPSKLTLTEFRRLIKILELPPEKLLAII